MRKTKQFLSFLMITALVLTGSPTALTKSSAASKSANIRVTNLSTKTLTLKKGKTKTLKVSQKAKFKSSKKKIVSVNSKGKLKALKKGKAKITITSKKNKKKKVVITVTVGKPVTKVTAKASKSAIYVNEKTTIKTTVAPAKASNKKLTYKSSNKKIAVVDAKGVVTGKAVGSATITVNSTDGSNKKARTKVQVKKKPPVKMLSAHVNAGNALQFQLSSAVQLSKANVSVQSAINSSMHNAKTHPVKSISTKNKIAYSVILDESQLLSKKSMVVVTVRIPGQNQVSQMISYTGKPVHLERNSKAYYSVSDNVVRDYFISYFPGYVTMKKISTPDGINVTYDDKEGKVRITGAVNKLGASVLEFILTDEYGSTFRFKTIYYLYDSTHVVGGVYNYKMIAKGKISAFNMSELEHFAKGGSGSYSYELRDLSKEIKNASVDSNGYLSGTVEKPGKYTFTYVVKDKVNNTSFADKVEFSVVEGYKIQGTVRDARGQLLQKGYFYKIYSTDENSIFRNADYQKVCDEMSMGLYRGDYIESDGKYLTYLPKGNYRFVITTAVGELGVELPNITKDINRDITLPIAEMKVTAKEGNLNSCTWYDSFGNEAGAKDYVLMRLGQENVLTSKYESGNLAVVTGLIKVTPTKATKSVETKMTTKSLATNKAIFPLGQTQKQIILDQDYVFYEYIAGKDETANLKVTAPESNLYVDVNYQTKIVPVSSNESVKTGSSSLKYSFINGHHYYIGVRAKRAKDIGYRVIVKKGE